MSLGSDLAYTDLADISKIHLALHESFRTGITYPLSKRKQQLVQLARMMKDNAQKWQDAIFADVGKPYAQTLLEVGIYKNAIHAIEKLEDWTAPDVAEVPDHFKPLAPTAFPTPKGVVLIIAPWNYPLTLVADPLICALAAGNCAALKPSELAPATAMLWAELVPQYLDPQIVRVVNGGVEETTRVLELKWDHIMYTGNGTVGRIVAAAAAKHLTPTSLELGGKSPVVIDPSTDLALAARRILWGKMLNAGQTCVAPDYILCPASTQPALVVALESILKEFLPSGQSAGETMGRIVNKRHFVRVQDLVSRTKGKLVAGVAEANENTLEIAPAIYQIDAEDAFMGEELFGPIIPIITVKDVDDAIKFIGDRDHPLALYVFTDSQEVKDKFHRLTRSGSLVFNDVVQQLAFTDLPLGGIGPSGHGMSGGKYGFQGFTHYRASIDVPKDVEAMLSSRYPPYTDDKLNITRNIHLGMDIPDVQA